MSARPITFLSDYGVDDEFAGVCRAVIGRVAPDAPVIDLTHGIARHDIRQGATVLANALPYAPAGVHLAVVDPGVGSPRKAVAIRVAAGERILVGPDNGLLWPAAGRLGGAVEAADISLSPARLEPVSATFHGRDVFAPVTARLAMGEALDDLGEALDPGELTQLVRSPPDVEPDAALRVEVGHVDRFGNLALIATAEEAAAAGLRLGHPVSTEVDARTHEAVYASTFADLEPGGLLVYLDATGTLALAANRDSAAQRLGVGAGDTVVLRPR
jgi:S-adenosyl-L-methionine hydrolase (adenosine-forming)